MAKKKKHKDAPMPVRAKKRDFLSEVKQLLQEAAENEIDMDWLYTTVIDYCNEQHDELTSPDDDWLDEDDEDDFDDDDDD